MTTIDTPELEATLEPFVKLSRDLKKAAETMSQNEARFLVDSYYQVQGYRIRFGNQIRALAESGEPHDLIRWMHGNAEGLEKNIQKALDAYSRAQSPVGEWLRAIPGIGPVLASGLLAHIDIKQAPYAGHILSYAGFNPSVTWEKGQKRPWNARLKVICFLAGESFCKVQNRPRDYYGKVLAKRKALEQEANELGMFADQAAEALQRKRYGADTKARQYYEAGKLPPAHIHARARRWAIKLFLSHLWYVWYESEYKQTPPHPYVLEYLGHQSLLLPPFWPLSDDVKVAQEDEIIDLSVLDQVNEEEVAAPDLPNHASLAVKIARFKRGIMVRNQNNRDE